MRRRPASALLDGRRPTLTWLLWRRRTSGSSDSRPTLGSTSWPWISREKLTRSWRCLPRARPTRARPRPTRRPSRSGDRGVLRRTGTVGGDRGGVSGFGQVPGHALPAYVAPAAWPVPAALYAGQRPV